MVRVGDGKKSIGVSKVGKWLSLVGGIEVGGKLRGLRFWVGIIGESIDFIKKRSRSKVEVFLRIGSLGLFWVCWVGYWGIIGGSYLLGRWM